MNANEQNRTAWIIILILCIVPVLRWATLSPLEYRFLGFATTMTSLGQITALLGMTLFSINMILAGRFKILDRYLGGLNNVYQNHHKLGALSFCLILFHPLLLSLRYIPLSLRQAALFLLPSENWAPNFGIIALLLFILLIVLTFFVDLGYKRWKFFHTFMIGVSFFAILHSFLATSDISRDGFLRFYVLGLSMLGFLAGFYQAFLSKSLRYKFDYEIKNIIPVSPEVIEIEMSPVKERLAFAPGQFIFVRFLNKSVGSESHPFSISSSSENPDLRISIKSLGDFTKNISDLKTGDKVKIEGPYGKFTHTSIANINQIWIAGGIGITPFLSMARSLHNNVYKIDLYYSVKSKTDAAFLEELLKISKIYPHFKVFPWFSDEKGRITGNDIFEINVELAGKDIFLCGPPPFMISLKNQFTDLGVSSEKIHWENFNFS